MTPLTRAAFRCPRMKREAEVGNLHESALARMNEELAQERDDALAARDKALGQLAEAEHRACQIKDAVDELRKGAWPPNWRSGLFVMWNRDKKMPFAVPPDRVRGFYEALKAKLDELGDWSRLHHAETKVGVLRRAVQAYVDSQAFQGICDEECELETALHNSY